MVDEGEQLCVRIALGERDPDIAYRDTHVRAELEQLEPYGVALSMGQGGALRVA